MSNSPKIRMHNCPSEQRAELRAALSFYLEALLGPKLCSNITTRVVFVSGLRRRERRRGDVLGFTKGSQRLPRDFKIRMDADIGLRSKLLILAHESVHIRQFARGQLRGYGTARTRWQGRAASSNMITYWDHPWEIEARGMELSLYVKWRRLRKALRHYGQPVR